MIDRLRRRLGSELDPLEPPLDLWERALTQEPGRAQDGQLGSRLAAGAVALLMMVGIGAGAWVLLDRPSRLGSMQDPAEILEVTCKEGETIVKTPVVEQQRDGVHVRLENPDRASVLFIRKEDDPLASWARGALVESQAATFVLPVPAGEMLVLCIVELPADTLEIPNEEFTPLTVLQGDFPAPGPTHTP